MVSRIRNLKLNDLEVGAMLAAILCIAILLPHAHAQVSPKPLSKDDVIKLLKGNVSPKRVEELAREHGIDFELEPETEKELQAACGESHQVCNRLFAALGELGQNTQRNVTPMAHSKVPQSSSLQEAVHENSTLRGVTIRDATVNDISEIRKNDPMNCGYWKVVVVTAVDRASPAAAAGLEVGDLVSAIILPGAAASPLSITADEFYRRAAHCTAECLVTVDHETFDVKALENIVSNPDGKGGKIKQQMGLVDRQEFFVGQGGHYNLLVGAPGANFVRLYLREIQAYAFNDLRSGRILPESFPIGWTPFAQLRAADPSQEGLVLGECPSDQTKGK